MKVLIGGGSGFVGRNLTSLLQRKGHEVIWISRNTGEGGLKRLTWLDIETSGLPDHTGAVVNLAGELLMDPSKRWNEETKARIRDSRIVTTEILTKAVTQASRPPNVYVGSSAIGYYPPSETRQYTEDDVIKPTDYMTQLTSDWEKASDLPASCPTRRVVLRIGIVLGREGGVVKNMIIPFWLGLGGRISTGTQWFPWIHVHDVAGIITHAIENKNVTGVLNATAPIQINNAEFTKAFAKALWRPAIIPVPEFVLRTVFGSERGEVMTKGQKVIPKRTLESGYQFEYPDIVSACKEFAHIAPNMVNWH